MQVCRPLHASAICTLQKAQRHVTMLLVVSLLFTVPRYFEHRPADNEHGFAASSLQASKLYTVVYRMLAFFLVMYLLPIVILTSLNVALLRALCKADHSRLCMLSSNRDRGRRTGWQSSATIKPSQRRQSAVSITSFIH